MTAVTIRPLARSDEAGWRRLWTGYLDFYGASVGEEVYRTTFERLLLTDEHEYRGRLAERDGVPVGLVHFLFHRHCWRIENVCYLQDLYVDPAARAAGVGRKLIEAVYGEADEAGCPSVYWLTQEFNEAGRRLYDRIGQVTPFIKYQRAS